MFIPKHDKNPLKIITFQLITICIMVLCIGIYYWQFNLVEQAQNQASLVFGLIPSELFENNALSEQLNALPVKLTLISYMFLHGSWSHLLGNMLFLWVFGDNIEDSMGHVRFVFFYLLCGIAGGMAHGIMEPVSELPLVGASGAIAGLLGAYLILHPRVKVLVLLFSRIPLRIPAYFLIIAWILFQLFSVYSSGQNNVVAWWAHIGGFIAGIILIIPMRYKQIPLFDGRVQH